MNPYDAWLARVPARRAPEVDFGTTWTSDFDLDEPWRLSWNSGTGELIAVSHTTHGVEVLGSFERAEDVGTAVPDWAQRALRPGGLDDLRADLVARERRLVEHGPDAVYGLVIRPDGTTTTLHEPVSAVHLDEHIGTRLFDVARVHPDVLPGRAVHMFVDDLGHSKALPVNLVATMLYGNTWPILGTAVVVDDSDARLPRFFVDGLSAGPATPTATPDFDPAPPAAPSPLAADVEVGSADGLDLT